LRNLQVYLGNKTPEYPYIFLRAPTIAASSESYNSRRLAAEGVPVRISTDGNQFELVRVIPTNMEFEVTFITNQYSGDLKSAEGFIRRWLMVRRNGALAFTVNYGMTDFPVSYAIEPALTLPSRDSPTDQEAVYPVVAAITVHGYVSEPVLGNRGRVNQVVLSDSVPTLNLPNEQFFAF